MYTSVQVNKVRIALRKNGYLSDVTENKAHCGFNNPNCELNDLLEDFSWQAEERMKDIIKSKFLGTDSSIAPVFATKTQCNEFHMLDNMTREEVIIEIYKVIDKLQPNDEKLQEETFRKQIKGKSNKIHVQFYLKLLDLMQFKKR